MFAKTILGFSKVCKNTKVNIIVYKYSNTTVFIPQYALVFFHVGHTNIQQIPKRTKVIYSHLGLLSHSLQEAPCLQGNPVIQREKGTYLCCCCVYLCVYMHLCMCTVSGYLCSWKARYSIRPSLSWPALGVGGKCKENESCKQWAHCATISTHLTYFPRMHYFCTPYHACQISQLKMKQIIQYFRQLFMMQTT